MTGSRRRSAKASGDSRCGLAGPAQQGADPGEQLLERERLHQVVVGAGLEPLDAVGDRVARGQHQDRRAAALGAKLAADLEPVDAGHEHVEDDQVGADLRGAREALAAVGGERYLESAELERPLERSAHRRLVVDDQQLPPVEISRSCNHGLTLCRAKVRRR